MMAAQNHLPTQKEVEDFIMLNELIVSVYNETKELSKKRPDDILNKLKVKVINRILIRLKELLIKEATDDFLELIDEDTLASNSDAVFIIGQFLAAMNQFRNQYYGQTERFGDLRWFTKENPGVPFREPLPF